MRVARAAAAVLALALVGCSTSPHTVVQTVTATSTVTVTAAPPSPSTGTTAATTPIGAPTYGGQDPHAEPCALLTVAEVEAATGVRVLAIKGQKNTLNDSTACSWTLAPVSDCACANFNISLSRHWTRVLPTFEQGWATDIRVHRATALPGIAHGELSSDKVGEYGSATFLSGTVIVGLGDRMGYAWKPADTAVLLKLLPLIAARAPKA